MKHSSDDGQVNKSTFVNVFVKSYCSSDVGVGLTQLLSQALRQGRHCVLSGAVEMYVSTRNNTMSTHAAKDDDGKR